MALPLASLAAISADAAVKDIWRMSPPMTEKSWPCICQSDRSAGVISQLSGVNWLGADEPLVWKCVRAGGEMKSVFDEWLEFHLANEQWIGGEVIFRIERLPFDRSELLSALASEIDDFRKTGLYERSLDSFLVHLNLILKFRMIDDDFPLLGQRMKILNLAMQQSGDQVAFLREHPDLVRTLEANEVERDLVLEIFREAQAFCAANRLPFERYAELNILTFAALKSS
jgi:hypothetical protein